VLALPASAWGFPTFARKYEMSCRNCHERAFPKLNIFGLHFKENGYQLPEGAEQGALARTAFEPGTTGETLRLMRAVPLSLRLQTHLEVIADTADDRGPVELAAPMDIFLVGGGSVAKNISAVFAYSLAPSPFLHYGVVGIHNVGGPGVVNVRAGRFNLLDFTRAGHRRLTVRGNPAVNVLIGDNPFGLDDHQLGIDLWGRPGRGSFFWELAVVNGAGDVSQADDLDQFKDVFAHMRYTFADRYTAGVFGYAGSATLSDEADGVMREWGDRFWRAGTVAELEFGWALGYAHVIYGHHGNAEGMDPADDAWFVGTRVQADLTITDRLLTVVRYDRVDASDAANKRQLATTNLIYLLATNARLTLELQQDLNAYSDAMSSGLASSRFFFHADVVF